MIYGMMCSRLAGQGLWYLNQTETDNLETSYITEKEWVIYYEKLLAQEQLKETRFADFSECIDPIVMDEFLRIILYEQKLLHRGQQFSTYPIERCLE